MPEQDNFLDSFTKIQPETLEINTFKKIGTEWMLITAGTPESCNTMTASWGALGILWNKPVAFCFVRPTRHTFGFMNKHDNFTLSFFPKTMKKALEICGSVSGKDKNKISEAGLHPLEFSESGTAFREADLVLCCRKLYYSDINPLFFLDPSLEQNYAKRDYHRMYVGEITGIFEGIQTI